MSWDDVEKTIESGPRATGWMLFRWTLVLVVALAVIGAVGRTVGWFSAWFSDAGQVAQEQFGARALLEKYEWFKNASAQLDAMNASIRVYDGRRTSLENSYKDVPRAAVPRDDRQELDQISAEVAGVKASYNTLAAEYNAQMAKFNYRFANAGQLPQGAERPVPREYRTYQEN